MDFNSIMQTVLTLEEMESQLLEVIHHDPALSAQLRDILSKARERVISDE